MMFSISTQPPYQDGIIAKAVTDVTNDGALHFSSAGNEGNFDTGTSGVWQGDFKSGGSFALIPGGDVHDFGKGTISNFILADGFAVGLFWSDPQGASSNDYDLYMMSPNLDEVLDASTDVQDGSQDPFEIVGSGSGLRILVVRNDGAAVRALHVNSFRGILALRTPGHTHGHGSVVKAFSVAAVDVATAKGGPFVGGPTEPVETFSSDGPRRMFYNVDGSTVNGNVLFAGGGGANRRKPDLTAADGVQVTTPGFNPFFGTSAAAPHAAAMGALLKAAKPKLAQGGIRTALTKPRSISWLQNMIATQVPVLLPRLTRCCLLVPSLNLLSCWVQSRRRLAAEHSLCREQCHCGCSAHKQWRRHRPQRPRHAGHQHAGCNHHQRFVCLSEPRLEWRSGRQPHSLHPLTRFKRALRLKNRLHADRYVQ